MTDLAARTFILAMVDEARLAGARQRLACETIGMQVRTLQRWRSAPTMGDLRPARVQQPANKLDDLERQRILVVANSVEFGHLPPSQIVPRLADQGTYVASESTFYRVLTAANQVKHRKASRPTVESSKPRAVQATGPNQLYSWDITYLPTTVRGVYFYLYMSCCTPDVIREYAQRRPPDKCRERDVLRLHFGSGRSKLGVDHSERGALLRVRSSSVGESPWHYLNLHHLIECYHITN